MRKIGDDKIGCKVGCDSGPRPSLLSHTQRLLNNLKNTHLQYQNTIKIKNFFIRVKKIQWLWMCRNQLQNFTRNLALGSSPAGCGASIKALAHHCASGTVHVPEERSELGISYLHLSSGTQSSVAKKKSQWIRDAYKKIQGVPFKSEELWDYIHFFYKMLFKKGQTPVRDMFQTWTVSLYIACFGRRSSGFLAFSPTPFWAPGSFRGETCESWTNILKNVFASPGILQTFGACKSRSQQSTTTKFCFSFEHTFCLTVQCTNGQENTGFNLYSFSKNYGVK